MGKSAKTTAFIGVLFIAATSFLSGCNPQTTVSSSQQSQVSSVSPASSIASSSVPSSSVASSIAETSSTVSKAAPAATFDASVKQTFSTTYTDAKYGDWGVASYSRPVFSGTAPSVKILNDYYDQLEAKWKTENEQAINESLSKVKNAQSAGSKYSNTVECKITFNSKGIISIVMDQETYMLMAAHPNEERSSHTFDTATGQELLLTDVLKVTQATAADAIAKEFTALKNSDSKYADIEIPQVKQAGVNTKFYVSDDGVCLYFNPYEIASYAHGRIEDCIPYSRKDLISDRLAQ